MSTRRELFLVSGASLLAACAATSTGTEGPEQEEEEVTPGEDLMREHGVLRRVLLVYEEGLRRIEAHQGVPAAELASAAGLVRRFVEDYHERTEEEFVFPRFERAGRCVELVRVLRAQHARGRERTETVSRLTEKRSPAGEAEVRELTGALRGFVRMYAPHAAREDTDLFPLLREIVGDEEYLELGEHFEDREHAQLGERGFETAVEEVAQLERALGIHDLAGFTSA